jgi:hypothetical protein
LDFGQLLSNYGLPGIIIMALGMVVLYQNKRIDALIERLFNVQEQRRLEALETSKELSQTLASFSQSTEQLVDKIQIVRGEK